MGFVVGVMMSTDILCPDCGGVIGAAEPGVKRCSCVAPTSKTAPAQVADVTKVCSACGKDVSNRPRKKDERGLYWCTECIDAEDAKKRARKLKASGMETCPDCSRQFPEKSMREFQLTRLCPTCFKERTKLSEKEEKKQFSKKAHKQYEYRTLLRLALLATFLILIAAAKQMGWLPFL